MNQVTVIGAGLAGAECAWQLARRGIPVVLREMKPEKTTPAHVTPYFAELCCSNSLRGAGLENAVGLLKEELRRLDSLILRCADATAVPAGGALAVDREGFARMVTEHILAEPNITLVPGEVTAIPDGDVVIASGPLTSDPLAEAIAAKLGGGTTLNFFDAAAPLVSYDSVDMDSAYFASRYDKGTPDYVNCPMTQEEYTAFWRELIAAVNFSPVGRADYRFGVPPRKTWREELSTDATAFGGTGEWRNEKPVRTQAIPSHGREQSIAITIPPLGAVILRGAGEYKKPKAKKSKAREELPA